MKMSVNRKMSESVVEEQGTWKVGSTKITDESKEPRSAHWVGKEQS